MQKIKVLFMGRKQVAAECLKYIASKSNVEVVGVLTDSHLAVSPTTDVANNLKIKLFDFDEALKSLKSGDLCFDIGFSMLYWRKLREDFISRPNRGIINFHPAPLPEYKGTAGYNLAIMEGLHEWATTAHYIDDSIDTGPIIEVKNFPISYEEETAKSLEKKSQLELKAQFVRIFERAIAQDSLLATTPNSGGRYISRSEMEAMKEIHDGDDVPRKIRAFWFPPYDGAYKVINGIKCTVINEFILNQLADQASSSLFTPQSN
jgi:methionyl-tRNA formyltransferase